MPAVVGARLNTLRQKFNLFSAKEDNLVADEIMGTAAE